MHILSLVLGIFGVVLIFVPVVNFIFSPMLSSAAIITGTLSRILLKEKGKEEDRTIASAGLTLGIVGMGLCLLLYGSCAWLVEEVFEPKMKTWTAERDSDVIEKKMDRMEKKIESETKRLEDKLGKSIERIEKQLPPQVGTGREEQEEAKDAKEAQKIIKDFMEKKRQMKEELKKWEQWLETMPILESKKGDEAPFPGAKPGAAKKPAPPAQAGEPAGAGTGVKPKPKKPKTGEAAGSKAPKIYKEIPAAKDKEIIKELVSPYDYY